ncbi:MAG: molybdate ABC transporter substrate-binding protein [Gammaproteobacteria bacterium]|nr:molybdate ABC transporter substrate-binding protein [Gammaproteobacteria bacterium]
MLDFLRSTLQRVIVNRINFLIASCCFTLYLWSNVNVVAEELTVAVATNFLTTAEELIEQFEEQSDIDITVVAGSSGQLFAQAKNGAPYDVFFSADQEKIEAIINENLGITDSRITYAIGRLCFMLNPQREYEQKAHELFENLEFNRIVWANPKLAPYGTAAEEVFDSLEVDLSNEKKKVIFADNVGKAYAIAFTGNSDAGMVALSSVLDDELSSEYFYVIPEEYYSPLRQDAIILSRSENEVNAREFIDFVQSSDAKAIIRSNGYALD